MCELDKENLSLYFCCPAGKLTPAALSSEVCAYMAYDIFILMHHKSQWIPVSQTVWACQ